MGWFKLVCILLTSTYWWCGNSSSSGRRTEKRWRGTTQYIPVVFEVRMNKWKEKKTMGPNNIKWRKGKDDMMVEYRVRVRRMYQELDAEKGTVKGE